MGRETPRCTLGLQDTKRVPTGETLLSLAYKTEAIIPIDISRTILRVEEVAQDQNDALLHLMLDHSKERRQQAQIRITGYQYSVGKK